jgi:hypothetical protein
LQNGACVENVTTNKDCDGRKVLDIIWAVLNSRCLFSAIWLMCTYNQTIARIMCGTEFFACLATATVDLLQTEQTLRRWGAAISREREFRNFAKEHRERKDYTLLSQQPYKSVPCDSDWHDRTSYSNPQQKPNSFFAVTAIAIDQTQHRKPVNQGAATLEDNQTLLIMCDLTVSSQIFKTKSYDFLFYGDQMWKRRNSAKPSHVDPHNPTKEKGNIFHVDTGNLRSWNKNSCDL